MVNENDKRFHKPPPLSTPREAPWREVEEVISLLKDLIISINSYNWLIAQALAISIPGQPGPPGAPGEPGAPASITPFFPLLQRDKWAHWQTTVATPGTALPLLDITIPPGFDLVVRAKATNTGNIYVGNNSGRASRSNERLTLGPRDSIKLKIKNASLVFIDSAVAGEGVECLVEV